MSHWLGDLAQALVESGEHVDWWCAEDEGLLVSSATPEGERQGEDLETTCTVHRRLGLSGLAASMMQSHLLPCLSGFGEVAVIGQGLEVAHLMIALDQRLRAADVREQATLVWLAPEAFSAADMLEGQLDLDGLKRACSIVAPNANVRQELTARRVGSLVVEWGPEGARRFVKDHIKRPRAGKRGAETRSSELEPAWS